MRDGYAKALSKIGSARANAPTREQARAWLHYTRYVAERIMKEVVPASGLNAAVEQVAPRGIPVAFGHLIFRPPAELFALMEKARHDPPS